MRAARARFRFDEYVRLEVSSPVKHEFLDGDAFAMAGGSPEHAALAGRIALALGLGARGSVCEVFTCDLRVRVEQTDGRFTLRVAQPGERLELVTLAASLEVDELYRGLLG